MSIDVNNAGLPKQVNQGYSKLWYCDADDSEIDLDALKTTKDLRTVSWLKNAGGIFENSITSETDVSEGDVYRDDDGNIVDRADSTSTKTISAGLLEYATEKGLELMYADSVYTVDSGTGNVWVEGDLKPSNKFLVREYAVKNKIHRFIWPNATHNSTVVEAENDSLARATVSYTALSDGSGNAEYFAAIAK